MKHVQMPFVALCGAACLLLGSCENQAKKTETVEGKNRH